LLWLVTPQLWFAAHCPQSTDPPQPSAIGPHWTFAAPQSVTVLGLHPLSPPHTLGVPPPPQLCGGVQFPQLRRPPHPSASGPQEFAGKSVHVFGVQLDRPVPHLLGLPPPPHFSGAWQVPHWISFPQPSPAGPQSSPRSAHVRWQLPSGAS
jgi:hypothetical protein